MSRTKFNSAAGKALLQKQQQQQQHQPVVEEETKPAAVAPLQQQQAAVQDDHHDDDSHHRNFHEESEEEALLAAEMFSGTMYQDAGSASKKKHNADDDADDDALLLSGGEGNALAASLLNQPDRGVLELPPMGGEDFLFVCGSNGSGRYVTMSGMQRSLLEEEEDQDAAAQLEDSRHTDLMFRASMRSALEIQNAEEDQREHRKKLERLLGRDEDDRQQQPPQEAVAGDQLWVSRYSPAGFSELLSDEKINLEVLQWMMGWKKFLAYQQQQATATQGGKNAKTTTTTTSAVPRPENNIALICGPPGVGKTTLAHVIAKHCGFDAIEVNASYSRSAAEMKNLIESATADIGGATIVQGTGNITNTVASAGGHVLTDNLLRLKCLILDEIDGSTNNVVKILLSLPLHRPVICLANNLYAPVLRELRAAVSFVRQVPPLVPQRIVARLEAIADRENINVDRHSLLDLALHCAGDIRQCLNTLFFVSRQVPKTGSAASSATAAGKLLKMLRVREPTVSMWGMWEAALERREKGKYVQSLVSAGVMNKEEASNATNMALTATAPASSSSGALSTRAQEKKDRDAAAAARLDVGTRWVARCASKCPELETVINGLHEWYCQLQYPDYTFESTAGVCDAFAWADRADPFSNHFTAICEAVSVIVFRTCATLTPRPPHLRNVMPREAFHWSTERQRCQELVDSFVETSTHCYDGSSTVVKSWCGPSAAAHDVLPFFVHLVSLIPAGLKLAPGVSQLSNVRNVRDQEALRRLVEIMSTYGITFEHDAAAATNNLANKNKMAQNNSNNTSSGGGGSSGKFGEQKSFYRREETEWHMVPDYEELSRWKRTTENLVRSQQAGSKSFAGGRVNNAGGGPAAGAGGGGGFGRKGDHNKTPEMGVMRAAAGLPAAVKTALQAKSAFEDTMKRLPNDVRELLVGEITRSKMDLSRAAAQRRMRPAVEHAVAGPDGRTMVTVDDHQAHGPVAPYNNATATPKKQQQQQQGTTTSSAKPSPAKPTAPPMPVARDFFGRPIVKKETKNNTNSNNNKDGKNKDGSGDNNNSEPQKAYVKYRFFDGATNSVKKPATVVDFL